MQWPLFLLVLNLACAWFMTGLIWFVQVVHYPQFHDVGVDAFKNYHARHTRLTTRVVIVPMSIELIGAAAMLFERPSVIPLGVSVTSLILVIIAWCSTAWLQVPRHNSLSEGFDSRTCNSLVITNGIRTFSWTARALLLSGVVAMFLHI